MYSLFVYVQMDHSVSSNPIGTLLIFVGVARHSRVCDFVLTSRTFSTVNAFFTKSTFSDFHMQTLIVALKKMMRN